MNDAPQGFGFESRAGQLSYPFLISAMLLAHRYLYPEFPGLRIAEFYLSMGGLALYIASRKFLIGPHFAAFQPPSAFCSALSCCCEERSAALPVTLAEYQPRRVLISVLFIPAARPQTSTSPASGFGTGTCR